MPKMKEAKNVLFLSILHIIALVLFLKGFFPYDDHNVELSSKNGLER